jgi:PAS domain S-box-containing protein
MAATPETYFQTIMGALDVGLVLLDERGRVEWANPASRRLLGRRAEDLIGGHAGEATTTADRQPIAQLSAHAPRSAGT